MLKRISSKFMRIFFLLFILASLPLVPFSLKILFVNSQTTPKNQDISLKESIINLEDFLLGKLTVWSDFFLVETLSVTNDNESNCYVAGTIQTELFSLTTNIFIGKITSNGTLVWIKQWDFQGIDIANDIVFNDDNEQIIVVGETIIDSDHIFSDLLVVCFDSNTGQEIWNNTYGEVNLSEEANSVIINSDHIYIAGTKTNYFHVYSNADISLTCINKNNGSLIWEKSYITFFTDRFPSLVFDNENDNIYLVSNRYKRVDEIKYYQYYLRKLTISGEISWEQTIGNETSPRINDLVICHNSSSIILLGDKFEYGNINYRDCTIIFYNFSGGLTKQITFGKERLTESANALSLTSDGSMFIVGKSDSEVKKDQAALLASAKSNGEIIYFEKTENFEYSDLVDIVITNNGYLVSVGKSKYNFDVIFTRLLISYTRDLDKDILSDFWEPKIGTDPTNPDTDGDGFLDGEEYLAFTDPLKARSNPRMQKIWRNMGIGFAIALLLGVIIIQIIFFTAQKSKFSVDQEGDKRSFIVRVFQKFGEKIKRRKE
ncbi:MAG: PQQ-like beta-propeller repeat protein [Candidatus Heimdallarchaeota archaeon]